MLRTGRIGSLILWGPPGTGKTTVARLLADETDLDFHQISAIFSGVADLKKVFEEARSRAEGAGNLPALASLTSNYGGFRGIALGATRDYIRFTAEPFVSPARVYEHGIMVYSFSKYHSISGERIGYLVVNPECDGAGPRLMNRLSKTMTTGCTGTNQTRMKTLKYSRCSIGCIEIPVQGPVLTLR